MFLLIVQSLAIYGGTAALLLWLAHRFVQPLRLRVGLILATAPLLFTGKAMLTGGVYAPIDIIYNAMPFGSHRDELHVLPDRMPLLADIVYQQFPWRAAVRAAFSEGRLPLWNPSGLAGEPLLAMQQPAALHPGTWIGMLLPLPQAWTFDMALRLLIALLAAYLFLRDLWCRESAALLGALGWAFSNWMVFYLGLQPNPAAAPFPLLLLGLRRVSREPGRRSAAIVLAALLLIVSAGHPETLLHVTAAAGLYFLFELSHAGRGRRLRPFVTALSAGALGLGLSAVLLLPLAEALPHTGELLNRTAWYAHQRRSIAPEESLLRLLPQAIPYAVGVSGHGRMAPGFVEPSAYAGSLLFPLALAGLFSRCRSRWFFLAIGLAGLAIWTKTTAADALAKLPLFDIAFNERLLFVTTFSLCALAALGANRLQDGEGAPAFYAGAVASLALLTWLFVHFRSRMAALEMPPAYVRERFLLQIVPLVAAIVILAILPHQRRATAGVAALLAVFAAQRTFEAGSLIPTMPSRIFYPPLSVLERIPRGVPYRTVAIRREFIPNVAALYGLEDVRGYEVMSLNSLTDTYPLWCVPQPVWFNRVDDPEAPFLAFLNVRWMLAPLDAPVPAGWPILAEGDGMRLFENPGALPRAFVPRLIRTEPDPARRIELLKSIGDFGERGVVEDAKAATGDWVDNGEARLEISAYSAQAIDLDVDARRETLVATSIPAWPGWKARVDGLGIDSVGYNHAFLAFRVPEGRHRLTLRYFPDSVVAGSCASGATLALCLVLLFRRGASSGPMAASAKSIASGERTRAADQEIHREGSPVRSM